MRNSPASIKVKEGGGGSAPVTGAEIRRRPGEGPGGSRFMLRDCSWWRTHAGAGEKSEEEGVAERGCYQLTTIPQIHPSLLLREEGWGGGGVGNEEVKLSQGKWGGE